MRKAIMLVLVLVVVSLATVVRAEHGTIDPFAMRSVRLMEHGTIDPF